MTDWSSPTCAGPIFLPNGISSCVSHSGRKGENKGSSFPVWALQIKLQIQSSKCGPNLNSALASRAGQGLCSPTWVWGSLVRCESCPVFALPSHTGLKKLQVVLSQPLCQNHSEDKSSLPSEPWEMIIKAEGTNLNAGTHLCLDRPEQHRQCSSVCREKPHKKNAVPIMKPGENHSQGSLYVNVHGLKLMEMLSEKQNEGFRKLSACVPVHWRSQQSTLVSLPGAVCWIRSIKSWRKCSCPWKMFWKWQI